MPCGSTRFVHACAVPAPPELKTHVENSWIQHVYWNVEGYQALLTWPPAPHSPGPQCEAPHQWPGTEP